jgi:uncharacterized low-complexity protein
VPAPAWGVQGSLLQDLAGYRLSVLPLSPSEVVLVALAAATILRVAASKPTEATEASSTIVLVAPTAEAVLRVTEASEAKLGRGVDGSEGEEKEREHCGLHVDGC